MKVIDISKSREFIEKTGNNKPWEVSLTLKGTGTFYCRDQSYQLENGTICVIPPYTKYRKHAPEGITECSVLIEDFREIGRQGLRLLKDDAAGSVKTLLDMMGYFSTKESVINQAVVCSMGDTLYHILASIYADSFDRDLRLDSVIEAMHQNISNADFRLDECIGSSGYSMGHFRRIFREMTGQTPVRYFNILRINHGMSLIQQYGASRSIKEIAMQCGFTDSLYFSRVFSQLQGISPQGYLKAIYGKSANND